MRGWGRMLAIAESVFKRNRGDILFFSHILFLAIESAQFNFVRLAADRCQGRE